MNERELVAVLQPSTACDVGRGEMWLGCGPRGTASDAVRPQRDALTGAQPVKGDVQRNMEGAVIAREPVERRGSSPDISKLAVRNTGVSAKSVVVTVSQLEETTVSETVLS